MLILHLLEFGVGGGTLRHNGAGNSALRRQFAAECDAGLDDAVLQRVKAALLRVVPFDRAAAS